MNEDIKERSNINPGPRKIFYIIIGNYELINNSLQKNYWNTEDVDDKIITMERIERSTKNKTKNGKSSGKDNSNSKLYKYARDSFHERPCFF